MREQISELDTVVQGRIDDLKGDLAVINIKMFGATGEIYQDATDILQSAINNYSVIFIPKGTYKITRSIYLKDNVSIIGNGAVLRLTNGAEFTTDESKQFSDITFCGINFIGSKVGKDSAVSLYGVKNLIFDKCTFKGFSFAGIKSVDGYVNDNVQVTNCDFVGMCFGVNIRPFHNVSIKNCRFNNLNNNGESINDSLTPPHAIYIRSDGNNERFEGYTSYEISDSVSCHGEYLTISNCIFDRMTVSSSDLQQPFAIKVSCTKDDTKLAYGKYIDISNNTIINYECAIFVFGYDDVHIVRNDIVCKCARESVANRVIRIGSGTNIQIIENIVKEDSRKLSTHSIILVEFAGNTDVEIRSNRFEQISGKVVSFKAFDDSATISLVLVDNQIYNIYSTYTANTDYLIGIIDSMRNVYIANNNLVCPRRAITISSLKADSIVMFLNNNFYASQRGTIQSAYGVYGEKNDCVVQSKNTFIGYVVGKSGASEQDTDIT